MRQSTDSAGEGFAAAIVELAEFVRDSLTDEQIAEHRAWSRHERERKHRQANRERRS